MLCKPFALLDHQSNYENKIMTQPLDRNKLAQLLKSEEQLFHKNHPKSYELYQRARKSLHGGVPMLWMIRWAGSFPDLRQKKPKARTSPMWMATPTLTSVSAIQAQ